MWTQKQYILKTEMVKYEYCKIVIKKTNNLK